MGIFTTINSFDNKILFRNIVIILLFIYFFIKLNIGLNVIFGIILAIVVIMYFTEKESIQTEIKKEQYENKLETIKPKLQKNKEEDIVDFVFSVQDFYVFNPQAYEEFIDNLDAFKELYDTTFIDGKLSHYYFQIAESKKENALNSFHSLIFKLPNDKFYTDKHMRAHKRLETLLNNYLNQLYDQCTHNEYKEGLSFLRRPINNGPKEYNSFFDKDFTYQFY